MPNSRGVWLSAVVLLGMASLIYAGLSSHEFSKVSDLFAQAGQTAVPAKEVASADVSRSHTHPLLGVVDGDTIHVLHGEDKVTVRMIGIDAPETGKGTRPKGCFGDEATVHLTELLHKEPVALVPDPTQSLYDKYGRALMYVEQNGKDINAQMIADGYAREYTYHTPYERQTIYRSLEDDARHAEKGMWAKGACVITAL